MDQIGKYIKDVTKWFKYASRHCQNGNQEMNRYLRKYTCIISNVNRQNLNPKIAQKSE